MTADELRALYRAEPYQPYELELTDGRTLTVGERRHIFFPPNSHRIIRTDHIDNFEIIDLDQIKSYRLLEAAVAAG